MNIYADSSGRIVKVARYERDGVPRPGSFDEAQTVEIDFSQNPVIDAALNDTPDAFTVEGGVLKRDGSTVEIAADGDLCSYRRLARQYVADVRSSEIKGSDTRLRLSRVEKAVALLLMLALDDSIK